MNRNALALLFTIFFFAAFFPTASHAKTMEQQFLMRYLNAKRAIAKCESAVCYQSAYGQYATAAERRRLQGLSKEKLNAEFEFQKEVAVDDINDKGLHVAKLETTGNLRRLYLVSSSSGKKNILSEFEKEKDGWKLAHP